MAKTKVIMTVGVSSSGKSTWAKEQVKSGGGKWKRVNKDDLRAKVDCGEYSKQNEKIIEESKGWHMFTGRKPSEERLQDFGVERL